MRFSGQRDPFFSTGQRREVWLVFRFLSNPDLIVLFNATINRKAVIMKFAHIPKAAYSIGQVITVHGKPMRVESYTHTGKNVVVHSLEGAPRFERIVCICTDAQAIEAITN